VRLDLSIEIHWAMLTCNSGSRSAGNTARLVL